MNQLEYLKLNYLSPLIFLAWTKKFLVQAKIFESQYFLAQAKIAKDSAKKFEDSNILQYLHKIFESSIFLAESSAILG